MKTVALLLIGSASVLSPAALAVDPPRGNLLELHSCELYAGGCIVSSESTLGGRYMVRAWDFSGGTFAGTDFAGLQVAVLQSSPENLAVAKADPGQAVVYLPETVTTSQREALLAWLKSESSGLGTQNLQCRVVPLHFGKDQLGYTFSAGHFLSIKTASIESCATGACGEALWNTPRTPTTVFTVAVDRASRVTEPLLQLRWDDAGKRSVFLGKIGEDPAAKSLYVSTAELYGPAGKLF